MVLLQVFWKRVASALYLKEYNFPVILAGAATESKVILHSSSSQYIYLRLYNTKHHWYNVTERKRRDSNTPDYQVQTGPKLHTSSHLQKQSHTSQNPLCRFLFSFQTEGPNISGSSLSCLIKRALVQVSIFCLVLGDGLSRRSKITKVRINHKKLREVKVSCSYIRFI